MKTLNVKVGKGYNIFIEKGLMSSCGKYIKEVSNAAKVCLISDTNVYKIYGNTVEEQLKAVGYDVWPKLRSALSPCSFSSRSTTPALMLTHSKIMSSIMSLAF